LTERRLIDPEARPSDLRVHFDRSRVRTHLPHAVRDFLGRHFGEGG